MSTSILNINTFRDIDFEIFPVYLEKTSTCKSSSIIMRRVPPSGLRRKSELFHYDSDCTSAKGQTFKNYYLQDFI